MHLSILIAAGVAIVAVAFALISFLGWHSHIAGIPLPRLPEWLQSRLPGAPHSAPRK